jgi:putative membrane protein
VMLFNHRGRFGPPDHFLVHHSWWWSFWGHFIPFVLFVALIGLVVWAVLRLAGRSPIPALTPAGFAPAVSRDPALEEVRLRYARGEMDRDEYIQRSRDLAGEVQTPRESGLSTSEPESGKPGSDETEQGASSPETG